MKISGSSKRARKSERDLSSKETIGRTTASTLPSPSSPGVKQFLRDLFGLDDEFSRGAYFTEKLALIEMEEDGKMLIETLADHLAHQFPKEKNNCQKIAKDYYKIRIETAKQLYKFISKASDIQTPEVRFALYEHFYCSLEELSFPFPEEFGSEFAQLGFQVLSRSMFLQYIDRGVFIVDEPLVQMVMRSLAVVSDNPKDFHFKQQLLGKLASKKSEDYVDFFKHQKEYSRFIVEYMISTISAKRVKEIFNGGIGNGIVDMEALGKSPFIPLSVFLDVLRREKDIDIPFLKEVFQKAWKIFEEEPHSETALLETGKP